MQELVLNLTINEANLVLEGLGNLPFAKVYQLVAKIQAQASEQSRARTDAPPANPAADTPSAAN